MIKPGDFKLLRIQAGLSQGELADLINKTQSYVARIEGGTLNPPLSVVYDIIRATHGWSGKKCSDIMTRDPETVDARNSVMQAVHKMREGDFSQLPVVRTGRVLGVVTMKDIFDNLELDLDEVSVEAIMSHSGSPMVDDDIAVESIIPLFRESSCVLVQRQGRLSGIITKSDLPKMGVLSLLEMVLQP